MKKIIVNCLIFIVGLFLLSASVHAFIPDPSIIDLMAAPPASKVAPTLAIVGTTETRDNVKQIEEALASSNCGDAFNMKANKCCYQPFTGVNLKMGGTGDNTVNIIIPVVNTILEKMLKPVIDAAITSFNPPPNPCNSGTPSTKAISDKNCICIKDTFNIITYCNPIETAGERKLCGECNTKGGIWTGMGCMSANLQEFIEKTILGTGVGLGGGISLLCIMFSAFQMQTSAGNAEKLKKAQELLTNCIIGLMVIIFSVLILKIIGVDILRIPGFN